MKKVAVIGATGNVGRKIIELLIERKKIDPNKIQLFASKKSAGKALNFGKQTYAVEDTNKCDFNNFSLALFATDSGISKQYVPMALEKGCRVIDSSSAYRLDPNVPLVVLPVNGHLVNPVKKLYAVPNCLASPISVVLKPLHERWSVLRITASTYQSTSGAGKDPMDELFDHSHLHLKGERPQSQHFPRPIPFNVIPQVDKILEDGFSYEEFKIIREVQKLISPEIKVMATAVRVPVRIGHSISLSIECEKPIALEEVREVLGSTQGIQLSDDNYTTPLEVEGQDDVFVGRLRKDPTVKYGIALWTVSDNLRRGAALDAIEIAEQLNEF